MLVVYHEWMKKRKLRVKYYIPTLHMSVMFQLVERRLILVKINETNTSILVRQLKQLLG